MDRLEFDSSNFLFNSPIEIGLRTLVMISNKSNIKYDLDRLVIFDYFILHASDLDCDRWNLHPSLPHRSSEIIIRRKLIQEGLDILVSKGLVDIIYDEEGLFYKSNEMTDIFINLLKSEYFLSLQSQCVWVINKCGGVSTNQLNNLVNEKIQLWGGEFEFEALMRGNYE
jgi:hypothetical protein